MDKKETCSLSSDELMLCRLLGGSEFRQWPLSCILHSHFLRLASSSLLCLECGGNSIITAKTDSKESTKAPAGER